MPKHQFHKDNSNGRVTVKDSKKYEASLDPTKCQNRRVNKGEDPCATESNPNTVRLY